MTGSPFIASKIPSKSARCMGRSFASARRRPPSSRATIISRIARDAVALEEHVLRAAEADAFGAEVARDARVARSVGVRTNAEAANFVRPAEQLRVRLVERSRRLRQGPIRHADDLARYRRQVAGEDPCRSRHRASASRLRIPSCR